MFFRLWGRQHCFLSVRPRAGGWAEPAILAKAPSLGRHVTSTKRVRCDTAVQENNTYQVVDFVAYRELRTVGPAKRAETKGLKPPKQISKRTPKKNSKKQQKTTQNSKKQRKTTENNK